MRLNVFHYPLEGWADAVAMNVLMGRATVVQLSELSQCSYQPLAEAFIEILPREKRHAELGEEGIKRITESDTGKREINACFDYRLPRVETSFGARDSSRFDALKQFGLRHRSNEDLLGEWQKGVDQDLDIALH